MHLKEMNLVIELELHAGQYYRGRGRLVNWDCKASFKTAKIIKYKCFNFLIQIDNQKN